MESSTKTKKRARPKIGELSTSPSPKVPKIDHQRDQREILVPPVASGQFPELLADDGNFRLRIGVDFGTSNTCAAFVVLSPTDDNIFDYINVIEAVHAQNGLIQFPTVMAIVPTKRKPGQASIVFAEHAIEAVDHGKTRPDHIFEYPKLGLVNDLDADQDVLLSIHTRHRTALDHAKSFDKLSVKYPGRKEEGITLDTIDDVIVARLKYFLCLLRASIAVQLEVADHQLDQIFDHQTEVGFAAPASWTDAILHRFLHQIQSAGWPSHCRIWSEPKCALAAHVSTKLAKVAPSTRDTVWNQSMKTVIIVDVGSGTTDLASIKPKRMNDKTIEFESIAASSGSLCGGRLLDYNIESHLKSLLGKDLQYVRDFVSDSPGNPISEEEFFHGFDFGECRKSFDGSKGEYTIRYRGNNLPSDKFDYMTQKAVELSREDMEAAHENHADRVSGHIEEQIMKTQDALGIDEDPNIEVLFVGGVTLSPFFSKTIQEKFGGRTGVTVHGSVEDSMKPLVPVGCILCLAQPAIGRRFRVKEAYGVPISKDFDPEIHDRASRTKRADGRKGWEVRNLMDWIRPVGDFAEKQVRTYNWSADIYDKNDKPYTKNPRKDPSIYPLTIEPDIWSTTDDYWGRQQHFPYLNVPAVKRREICGIDLSQGECSQITTKGVGFYRHNRTGQWSFRVPVRITLQWLDVRASWTAEIPKCGYFTDDPDQPICTKEVRFATVEHHGHKVGDKVTDEELDDAPEEELVITRPIKSEDGDLVMDEV